MAIKNTQDTRPEQQQWSGPLPPPALVEHYEQLQPGMADRIMALAEAEAAHVREIERLSVEYQREDVRRSTYCALFIGCVALVGGTVAVVMGHDLGGGLIGGGGVVALVGTFISGRDGKRGRG